MAPVAVAPAKMSRGSKAAIGCAIAAAAGLLIVPVVGLLAAIAIPSFVKARTTSQQRACINNLRIIDAAKEQWALAEAVDTGAEVDLDAVNAYIKGAATPLCPAGGVYTYHVIGVPPACSIGTHVLPGAGAFRIDPPEVLFPGARPSGANPAPYTGVQKSHASPMAGRPET